MTIEKPEYPFNKELKHRNTRRAAFCNYLDPGFFMITITSAPRNTCFFRHIRYSGGAYRIIQQAGGCHTG